MLQKQKQNNKNIIIKLKNLRQNIDNILNNSTLLDIDDNNYYINYIDDNELLKFSNGDFTITNKNLIVRESSILNAGLGVYTEIDLNIYDIVEVAPTVKVQKNYLSQEDNILNNYVFNDYTDNNYYIVSLGYGSMYNHKDEPNVNFFYHDNKMIYMAVKPIKAGEELFISYGDYWWDNKIDEKK